MRVPIRKSDKHSRAQADPRITAEKLNELKDKLRRLKDRRFHLAREVKDLSEGGDFSENAGYQAAKGQLRGVNQRILEIESQLNRAVVIAAPSNTAVVQLGHRVTVELNGRHQTYQILGSTEANPGQGIISGNSPIGSALIGRRVGETITFQSSTKTLTCRIIGIE